MASRAIGPATSGPRAISAMNSPTTPTPSISVVPFSPMAMPSAATARNSTPRTMRLRDTPARSTLTSRIAANGGTRPERMAGAIAHSSVTITPTSIVMTNPFGLISSDAEADTDAGTGQDRQDQLGQADAAEKPSSEPPTPTTSASTSSDLVTCPRLAPIARSSAFSC